VGELAEGTVLAMIDALRTDGWYCRPQFLDIDTIAALRGEIAQQRAQFSAAAVGRAQQRRESAAIRSDATLWLNGGSVAQRNFLALMEDLRLALNRHLYLGLFDYEAHYSHYAAGAFYRRHLDIFNEAGLHGPRRVLSTVCYLNDDWRPEHCGELVLWDSGDREVARITPMAGTAVFFLSAELPHEVLPATVDRYSIAGWFRAQGQLP
jgi:SM-20-related protein